MQPCPGTQMACPGHPDGLSEAIQPLTITKKCPPRVPRLRADGHCELPRDSGQLTVKFLDITQPDHKPGAFFRDGQGLYGLRQPVWVAWTCRSGPRTWLRGPVDAWSCRARTGGAPVRAAMHQWGYPES
jgi:hypothetical protein